MVKINKALLPVKIHYFLFMAAMGPILPQIAVFGKQLGISPEINGYITSVLPVLYILSKPGVGFLADYFTSLRKFIFVLLILTMTLCYAGFYFIPQPTPHLMDLETTVNFTISAHDLKICDPQITNHESLCTTTRQVQCVNSNDEETREAYIRPMSRTNSAGLFTAIDSIHNGSFHICLIETIANPSNKSTPLDFSCRPDTTVLPDCLYNTLTFWLFVVLMCLGTIGFNVTNCISDAICFDVLGESQEMKYGAQRVWGTIGFGVTALIAGIAVDMSTTDAVKSFTPALIIMIICSGFDLFSTTKLKLPKLSSTDSIFRDVWELLSQRQIVIFLVFATLAGILDSFIIYFMFWHLEEVAIETGYMTSIKLIEGCVVAAECLCGEIPMFLLSGKILKKIGYVHCLSLCFFTYSIRLGLISLIPNPWWLVGIELVMQGCTYALCYTCIVAYASAVAPPGTSATVQGLVAGMDDGVGFAIGSLIGGQAYKYLGGRRSFQVFSFSALIACIAHIILRPASKHENYKPKERYVIPNEQMPLEAKT